MANIAKNPKISLIAAISKERRALGFQNKLLWKIGGDLPRFKELTTGHAIIMGRKTYESIGRPLPNRTNIVISRSSSIPETKDLIIVDSVEKALDVAKQSEESEIFIIGGGEIYKQSLPFADHLYLTIVDDEPEADTFFPDYSEFKREVSREDHPEHTPPFSYVVLQK